MPNEPIRCPDQSRFEGDLVGCGSTNVQRSNDPTEPYTYDCLDCGLWFHVGDDAEVRGHRPQAGCYAHRGAPVATCNDCLQAEREDELNA